ncbi:MAG: hypothetical protein E6I63_01560 [Chloroflexi bacterium]|nr:MAG: hypothetical protein E6I63_01560 [Chloroflexota bacterium]
MSQAVPELSRDAAEDWIRSLVKPIAPIEVAHERPWSTVLRVPLRQGSAWFKACSPVQAFEPALTASLYARWPDRVAEVIGHDAERAWLLLADAGAPLRETGNPPEAWLAALPGYAELQHGEAIHADEHLAVGVPDMRPTTLPARYRDLVGSDLPLDGDGIEALQAFAPRFAELCTELVVRGVPSSVQHDDLHSANLYIEGDRLRVLDWGDASISHPFMSLVVTFRFLEETNRLAPTDPWISRLRDAYLEPWGSGLAETFELAIRLGMVAHAIAWLRQRDYLPPEAIADFDRGFTVILRRALRSTVEPGA